GLFGAVAFSFQAEDGIRDFHVTGVQTCALPISSYESLTKISSRTIESIPVDTPTTSGCFVLILAFRNFSTVSIIYTPMFIIYRRSEERRVGKECRTRWAGGLERRRLDVARSTG